VEDEERREQVQVADKAIVDVLEKAEVRKLKQARNRSGEDLLERMGMHKPTDEAALQARAKELARAQAFAAPEPKDRKQRHKGKPRPKGPAKPSAKEE
jgi:hypothetical protein